MGLGPEESTELDEIKSMAEKIEGELSESFNPYLDKTLAFFSGNLG